MKKIKAFLVQQLNPGQEKKAEIKSIRFKKAEILLSFTQAQLMSLSTYEA